MENSKDCSSKKCSSTKCVLSVISVFIFTFVYDWLVHGKLLTPLYMATPKELWRPVEQMQAMLPWCLAFHFLIALVVTSMFKNYKNYSAAVCAADPDLARKCAPCARGICFGLHLGLIFGLGMFATYIFMPISLELAGAWLVTGLFKGIGIGVVLSLFCKKKETV